MHLMTRKKKQKKLGIISMKCLKNKVPNIGTNAFASQDTKFSLSQYIPPMVLLNKATNQHIVLLC